MTLQNRVIVIAGATGGLGRIVTQRLSMTGAKLVLVGSQQEKLDRLAKELCLSDHQALSVTANLRDPQAPQQILQETLAKFGKVDALLNFVGGWFGGKTVVESEAEELQNMLNQHLWTTFYLAQAFVPVMVTNGWGRIVVITSPNAGQPPAKGLAYSVGKAAQETLLLTLSEELAGSGVTANMIRVKTIDIDHQRDQAPTPKNSAWTTPEEISAMIEYLLRDEAGMLNGARIPLYGSR